MAKLSVIADGIDMDLQHAATVAKAAGLQYLELQYLWGKRIGDLCADEITTAKDIAARLDIQFSCLSHDLFGKLRVLDTEIGDPAYEAEMAAMQRVIASARQLDTKLVRIMCFCKEMILFGTHGAETSVVTQGAWMKFVRLMEPPVQLAADQGIQLVVETSNKGMVNSAYLARRLVDELGLSALKVLWDPANALYATEPAYPDGYEALAGGYIGHMHMKDIIAVPSRASVECCVLGEGQMAPYLRPIADALERDSYDGFISLESIYRPLSGTLEDGFHASVGQFKSIFS